MATPLAPFQAPPTPPELLTLTQDFERRQKDWANRAVRWVESLIREIASIWSKLRLAINEVNGRVDVLDTRVKDIYTFPYQGSVSPGLVALPLRAVTDSTLIEVFAAVGEAPTGTDIVIHVLKNGVSVGTLSVLAGQLTGAVALTVPLVKDTDSLQPEIMQAGSGEPGHDLVIQYRAR